MKRRIDRMLYILLEEHNHRKTIQLFDKTTAISADGNRINGEDVEKIMPNINN